MNTINFNGKDYPALQAEGFASQYCFPFAKKVCKGFGVDIGYSKPEWKLPGAVGIDLGKWMPTDTKELTADVSADNFNTDPLDYCFSSHMAEHYVGRFQSLIEYWLTKLKDGGVVFLYLPNCMEQEYWAWVNEKHIHVMSPEMLKGYCEYLKSTGRISSHYVTEGFDLNQSFYCVITK